MKEVIMALLAAVTLCAGNANINEGVKTGYIFLGDSRTVGMDNTVDIESNNSQFVVAKVGEGYNWMIETGLPKVTDIIEENTDYNRWVLITNLGVNDLRNTDKYVEAYKELSKSMSLYVVSVNPCKGSYNNLNSKIDSFNETMKELDCVTYIDTCTGLRENGFESSDGLHYGDSTYESIYNEVINTVAANEASKIIEQIIK